MSKLLFIDSDDIEGLSEALREALERRGVVFDHSDEKFLFQETGGVIPGSCGMKTYGSCGQPSSPSYGGCGYYPRC